MEVLLLMGKHKITLLLICVAVIAFQFDGFSALANPGGLGELEKLVLERDAAIVAARHNLDAANSQLHETQSRYGPEINAFYTYYPEGPNLDEDELDTEHLFYVRLKQDLIELCKVKQGRVQEMQAEVDVAKADLQEAESAALYEFRAQYVEVFKEKVQADGYLRLKDAYQKLLELRKRRYLNKEALLGDVLKVEEEVIEAKESYLFHKNNFERKKALLAESLGVNVNAINAEGFEPPSSLPSEEVCVDSALKNRGEIRVLEARGRQERGRASITGYEDVKLSPFVGYRLRESRTTGLESGPEIGVTFSMPLSLENIKNNRYDRFEAKESYWKAEAEWKKREIERDIRRAYEDVMIENARLLEAERLVDLKSVERRTEQTRLERPLRTVDADTANVLRYEADIIALDIRKTLAQCERAKKYYELLYLAGLPYSEAETAYPFGGGHFDMKPYARALWVWGISDFLGEEQSEAFIVSFCRIKGVQRVYLSVNRQIVDSLSKDARMPNFIANLHRAGIGVSALMAENTWVYPQNRENLLRNINGVITYNSIHEKEARFDGIHLDIEPHVLTEWDSRKQELLELLAETFAEVKKTLSSAGAGMPLEVDIPTFYDNVDSTILGKILDSADVITIMAYERRNPDKVVESVKTEMEAAAKAGKGAVVGLNAKDFPDEAELEELIVEVGDRLSSYSSLRGFGIHDFENYRTLAGR